MQHIAVAPLMLPIFHLLKSKVIPGQLSMVFEIVKSIEVTRLFSSRMETNLLVAQIPDNTTFFLKSLKTYK
jgi:hypothetical protein